jgi:cytochrome b5
VPSTSSSSKSSGSKAPDAAGFGIGLYAVILVGGALAFGAYKYLQAQQEGVKA